VSYNKRVKNKRQGSKTKKFLIGGIVIIFVFAVLISAPEKKSVPHQNITDAKISQYSDKYITRNAITTNPEFKKIAFEAPPHSKTAVLSSQFAAVFESLRLFMANLFGSSPKEVRPKEYGSWIWTPIMQMTPEYMEQILSGAKANGIDTMYLSVDSYLDIFVMKDGREKENLDNKFSEILEDFITRANQKGIAVDAEAGWRNWAEEGNQYKAFAVVNFVKNFNETHKNKFRGFQYDVEPYLLDSYKKDKESILKKFVALVDQTEHFLEKSDLRFSVVVPDFYDEKDELTPVFSYNENKGAIFKHLLNILDRRPNNSIIVMSYRNLALGEDGSIQISQNEMQTANSGKYQTKIIIAQETGDVPPPYITFHDTSKKHFDRQVNILRNAFDSNPNFGGIAVHYVNAFLALK